jgi:hypothetical protein
MDNGMQQPNESFSKRKGKNNLEEIVNGVLDSFKQDNKPYQQSIDKEKGFRKKPFMSPNFN